MSEYQNNSIFWVETSKIQPNPYQPRREFAKGALEDLADSIRQYGVLQPLVVTRKEIFLPDNNGMDVIYELIAGERRLRASKIAGLQQVPVIIRKETDDKVKLELAIIENLQREDLNPIDRALAFEQLYKEFSLTHVEIGKRMGKSRVYVSNTLRLLSLTPEIKQGLMEGRITEGHTRPLLMLSDRPEEQATLYKEIMVKKMSVRDAEKVARKIAQDKVRKKEFIVDPKIQKYEKQLAENLGTRVHIEPKENGGQITIDYFTVADLEQILNSVRVVERNQSMMESYLDKQNIVKKIPQVNTASAAGLGASAVGQNMNNITSPTNHGEIEIHHKELPEYHRGINTEIQEYHQPLAAVKKKEEETIPEKNISHDSVPPVAKNSFIIHTVKEQLENLSQEESLLGNNQIDQSQLAPVVEPVIPEPVPLPEKKDLDFNDFISRAEPDQVHAKEPEINHALKEEFATTDQPVQKITSIDDIADFSFEKTSKPRSEEFIDFDTSAEVKGIPGLDLDSSVSEMSQVGNSQKNDFDYLNQNQSMTPLVSELGQAQLSPSLGALDEEKSSLDYSQKDPYAAIDLTSEEQSATMYDSVKPIVEKPIEYSNENLEDSYSNDVFNTRTTVNENVPTQEYSDSFAADEYQADQSQVQSQAAAPVQPDPVVEYEQEYQPAPKKGFFGRIFG